MATFTLANLRDSVRFRGDYQNVAKFPNADVNREIQAAWAELYELIADTYEGYWMTTSATVTTQSAFMALPTDYWRVFGVDRMEGTNEWVEMRRINTSDRNRFGSDTGKPVAYRLTARGVDFYPSPNGLHKFRVVYTPVAPALGESTAQEYFNGWENYIVNGALLRLDQREQRPLDERIAVMDRERQRVMSAATRRNSQEPEYLNLREYVSTDPWDREVF
jgi:hypothetical protein